MSYGTNESEAYRQAGIYAGRILKGEKPAAAQLISYNSKLKGLGFEIPVPFPPLANEERK